VQFKVQSAKCCIFEYLLFVAFASKSRAEYETYSVGPTGKQKHKEERTVYSTASSKKESGKWPASLTTNTVLATAVHVHGRRHRPRHASLAVGYSTENLNVHYRRRLFSKN
jgi:hypothetical protein